jgi:hypothetical protein
MLQRGLLICFDIIVSLYGQVSLLRSWLWFSSSEQFPPSTEPEDLVPEYSTFWYVTPCSFMHKYIWAGLLTSTSDKTAGDFNIHRREYPNRHTTGSSPETHTSSPQLMSYFFKIPPSTTHPSSPVSSQWPFLFRLQTKIQYVFPIVSLHARRPASLILHDFITSLSIGAGPRCDYIRPTVSKYSP